MPQTELSASRPAMHWAFSHRGDPIAVGISDRHYNRQKVGSPQFVPPGRCIVLLSLGIGALWVTSWPLAQYVKHAWAGAWVNSLFRNERRDLHLSSDLIREAIALTRAVWPRIPDIGMVTFINEEKIKRKRDPGRCYLKAGFKKVGYTKGGLLTLQMLPHEMPPAARIQRQIPLDLPGFEEPSPEPVASTQPEDGRNQKEESASSPEAGE